MTNDPYEILGVSRNASPAEIKAAYRELVKKYHPDKYQGNPLADLAEEKLQQINEAYDALIRDGGASSGSSSAYQSESSYNTGSSADYSQIRMAVDRGDLYQAEQMLINIGVHDAEWYFLSGVVAFKKGYIQDGIQNVQQAVNMAPENQEYRSILSQMNSAGGMFRSRSNQQGYGNMDTTAADMLPCSTLPFCFCC